MLHISIVHRYLISLSLSSHRLASGGAHLDDQRKKSNRGVWKFLWGWNEGQGLELRIPQRSWGVERQPGRAYVARFRPLILAYTMLEYRYVLDLLT